MTDFDDQILELFLLLTQDQRQTALDFLRLLGEGSQGTNPSAPATTSPQDK